MSSMTESLLLTAQKLRLEGDLSASISLLRTVLSQCNSDVFNTKVNDNMKNMVESNIKKTWQMRQMAAYQLALLLLQRSGRSSYMSKDEDDGRANNDETEADELLWKLGYKLRLSIKSFGYPSCYCQHKVASSNELPLHTIDNAMPSELFDALKFAFRPGSKYWTEFYSQINVSSVSTWSRDDESSLPSNQFASHNIQLPTHNNTLHNLQNANSLLEQIAIITKLKLSQRFSKLQKATSVEIWSHQRPPDGSHQLHYDMDEIRLHQRRKRISDKDDSLQHDCKKQKVERSEYDKADGVYCPLVSCVLTIHVPNSSGSCLECVERDKGSPTIICNQSILDQQKTPKSKGWLCYPKPNRLLAFEGSLLHGVVPGIPEPDSVLFSSDDSSNSGYHDSEEIVHPNRVTLMMGFWADGVCTQSSKSIMGPNMVLSGISSDNPTDTWAYEFSPLKIKKLDQEESITDLSYSAAIEVEPLWTPINHCSNFCEFISGEEHDLKFSGRFFLKSDSMHEIDDDILHRLN